MAYRRVPVQIQAGIQPTPDETNQASLSFVDGNNIRFYAGRLQKIGGWEARIAAANKPIRGCPRRAFGYVTSSNNEYLILGSDEKLYVLNVAGTLTNITPLKTTEVYDLLGTDPFAMTNMSTTVTVTHNAHPYLTGDTVKIFGVSGAVNGVPEAELNEEHVISNITTNTYDITVTTAATSTGTGGGSTVKVNSVLTDPFTTTNASQTVTVTHARHGYQEYDRIKISGVSGAVNGIPDTELNAEFEITNIMTNSYDIEVSTSATSTGTGGGSAVSIYEEIADGSCDASFGTGWGIGLWGVGLWGVSQTSTSLQTLPRIWSIDLYGSNVALTPGNGGKVYEWDGDITAAPVVITNAPTSVNYIFSDKNILIALGVDGVFNKIGWCDQGDSTVWTAAATNQAGDIVERRAGRLFTHLTIRDTNLLFTKNQIFAMTYINEDDVWRFDQVIEGIGIIAQNAVAQHNGVGYFMGQNDFYYYNGGTVQSMAAISAGGAVTVKRHVFDNLNREQQSKCYAWHNPYYDEIWFHYPTTTDNPDSYVAFGIENGTWTIGTMDRYAAESPRITGRYPQLVSNDTVYMHEKGVNADGAAMEAYAETNFVLLGNGDELLEIDQIIPDATITGSMDLIVYGKDYPLSTSNASATFTITPTTEKVDLVFTYRLRKYRFICDSLDSNFRLGLFYESVQDGTPI